MITAGGLAGDGGWRLVWRSWVHPLTRPGPQRWLVVLAAVGWVVLVSMSISGMSVVGMSIGGGMAVSSHPMVLPPDDVGWIAAMGTTVLMWTAMLVATMLPLIVDNVRFVSLRSTPRRRVRATVDVVFGWASVWVPIVALLAVATWVLESVVDHAAAVVIAFAAAVAWEFTAARQRAVARCHRSFAPPIDRRAPAACRRFGRTLGANCATSCWAVMSAMALAGHQLVVVLPLAWVPWYARRRPHHDPRVLVTASVIGLVGLATALVALAP